MDASAGRVRPFCVGTSWKMNKTRREAVDWVRRVRAGSGDTHSLTRFVMPPFTALTVVERALEGTDILLGAQNMHESDHGAHTGEISAAMLVESGCALVALGHSERRAHHAETDERVRVKLRQALGHGLRPLVCVGDTAVERDASAHVAAVVRQTRLAFDGLSVDARQRCLLAYEPVWAIGEGAAAATPEAVVEMHAALKAHLPDVAILYGGSVDVDNAGSLAVLEHVDGLFVGRAALDADGFVAILDAVRGALDVSTAG